MGTLQNLETARFDERSGHPGAGQCSGLPEAFLSRQTTSLVTRRSGFYNPSNTAQEAVLSFIRNPRCSTARQNGWAARRKMLEYPFHLGISQEQ
jgi:hypothetical protein